MRIRTIKPEFWTDKRVASWDVFTRLLFIGLWSAADDHGRGSAEPERLSAELFPYDLSRDSRDTLARVSEGLRILSESGRIALYEVGEEAFYEVTHWTAHQRVDHPGKSRIPNVSEGKPIVSRHSRESLATLSRLEQGTGIREQGSGNRERGTGTFIASAAAERDLVEVESTEPPKPKTNQPKPRQRNPLFDTLAELEGGADNLTRPAAKRVGVALSVIAKATPNLTPDEIRRRIANLRLHMPHALATATSLASHWARCASGPDRPGGDQSAPENPRNVYIGTPETRAAWERDNAEGRAAAERRELAGEIPFT